MKVSDYPSPENYIAAVRAQRIEQLLVDSERIDNSIQAVLKKIEQCSHHAHHRMLSWELSDYTKQQANIFDKLDNLLAKR
jgi:hypothetical protein